MSTALGKITHLVEALHCWEITIVVGVARMTVDSARQGPKHIASIQFIQFSRECNEGRYYYPHEEVES